MRILQVLPSLDVGGVERGVIDLARAIRRTSDEIVVVSSGGELVGQLHKLGVMHYTLPVHQKSLFSLGLVGKLADIIHRERIDLVHARSRVPAWIAWMACRRTGIPLVTTCHGYYSTHALSRVMGWGKKVIVISRVIGRHMIDDFGVPPDRIRLVHRGIDLNQFTFVPDKYDRPVSKTFRIINVGRLSPIKGQVEFLKAVHRLRQDLPQIEVLIVGSEGKGRHKYTEQLQKTIEQLGLSPCVQMLGTRRDIPELIAQSDLLVLATLVPEAFGRVVVEAGAVGTAVVATRVGGVLDIIDHEENGLLVPAGEEEPMAKAMFSLLTDRKRSREYALALRRKIEHQFTLEQMVDKTLAVYHEIAKQKKILIFKLGAMGDVILGIPSIRMIRHKYPRARIAMAVDKKFASLVSKCPYLDDVIPVERSRMSDLFYLLRVARKLRLESFDVSVDLQNSKWTHLLSSLAHIPERYGFSRGKASFLLNRPVKQPNIAEAPVKNQFRILSKLGITECDETLELWPDGDAESRVDEVLSEFSFSASVRTVGLVIGSSPRWPTKRWPAPFFRELALRLIREKNCQIILIGSSSDREAALEFHTGETEGVMDLVGKTRAQDLAALMHRVDVLVTGDTAPLHIASATATRMVCLFGPTDSRRHVSTGTQAVVLQRRLPCQPCYQGVCKYEEPLACLKHIPVREVYDAVLRHLDSLKPLTSV